MESDGKGEVVRTRQLTGESWVPFGFLFGYRCGRKSQWNLKNHRNHPRSSGRVGRTVSVTEQRQCLQLWQGSRWCAWQEMEKGSLSWATVCSQSVGGWISSFFDIRSGTKFFLYKGWHLSDPKSCWWHLSQGRGEPAPAKPSGCRVMALCWAKKWE